MALPKLNIEQFKALNRLATKIPWDSITFDTVDGHDGTLAILRHSKAAEGKNEVACLLDLYGGGKVVKLQDETSGT